MKVALLMIMLAITSCGCETMRDLTANHPTQLTPSMSGSDKDLYDKCAEKAKEVTVSGKLADCGAISKPAAHNFCCGQKVAGASVCLPAGEAYSGFIVSIFSQQNAEVNCGVEATDFVADALTCGKAGISFPTDGSADICTKVTLKEAGSVCCRGTSSGTNSCYSMTNYSQVGIAAKTFDASYLQMLSNVSFSCGTAYDNLVKNVNSCQASAGKTKEDCAKSSNTGFSCCYVNSKCQAIATKDAAGNTSCTVKSSSTKLEIIIWLFALVLSVLV